MLDLRLEGISCGPLQALDLRFDRNTHTALIGPEGGGKTSILRVVAGTARPRAGRVIVGSRDVTAIRAARRPLLYVGPDPLFPLRWSALHWVLAALRTRTLDREDRMRELELIREKWGLEPFLERRVRDLSSGERTRLRLAVIEALHPAILLAERVLEGCPPASARPLADQLYRTLRVMGTTVISEVAHAAEIGHCDRVVVIAGGRLEQSGVPQEIYQAPVSPVAAEAIAPCNLLDVRIRNGEAESPIGRWDVPGMADGNATAMIRPSAFTLAGQGEDSDLIFGIEEAGFSEGQWHLRGFISGGISLEVSLEAADLEIHKGKLLPLRLDFDRIVLFPKKG